MQRLLTKLNVKQPTEYNWIFKKAVTITLMEFSDLPKNQPVFIEDRIEIYKNKNSIIKSFVERWDIKLSNSQEFIATEERLMENFKNGIEKATDKLYFVNEQILDYEKYKSIKEHEGNQQIFIGLGYHWYLSGNDFTLKDFLLFKIQTRIKEKFNSEKVYLFEEPKDEKAIISQWKVCENNFKFAAKGYAYSKYIKFLNSEKTNTVLQNNHLAMTPKSSVQITNEARDRFFLLIFAQDNAIDDVKKSSLEIMKICEEVENNISIKGIDSAQYLCYYLDRIDVAKRAFEKSPVTIKNINVGSRIRILVSAYNRIFTLLLWINKMNNTSILPIHLQSKTQQNKIKISVPAYALMHVYLAMFNGQPITQQNKNQLAEKYGYGSGTQLRNEFTKYQAENERLDLSSTNKKSANAHLQRFKDILPLLENENLEAYKKAKSDFAELEKKYNKHY
jgi:hypothetical protein